MTDAAAGAANRGKVMLVAGGTGSVGRAVAREAAQHGWSLVVHGRDGERLDALRDELRASAAAETVALAVADGADAARLVERAAQAFGRLDAVVDCLSSGPRGFRLTGPFQHTEPGGFAAFLDQSAAWFQRLAHAAYPHLARRGGTLIGFVSDAGKFAAPNQTIVGAARAATIGFMRNLAVEAARDGIRVHCISPSYVAGSDAMARLGSDRMAKAEARASLGLPTAEDIAPVTVFLCGDGARRITGQAISVNGGLQA